MTATSPAKPSALPDAWIDRLFQRFSLMFGNSWASKWGGLPMPQVKALWAEDLAFASAEQIKRALDHCKAHGVHPPSSPEFVSLCRQFAPPPSTAKALPDKRGAGGIDPNVRAEIDRFLNRGEKRDPKDWARQVLSLEADGSYPSFMGVQMARRALGMDNNLDGKALA